MESKEAKNNVMGISIALKARHYNICVGYIAISTQFVCYGENPTNIQICKEYCFESYTITSKVHCHQFNSFPWFSSAPVAVYP